jgi:hypothetical protein
MNENAKNFEDFVEKTLENDSIVYISPRMGKESIKILAEHPYTQKAVMSEREAPIEPDYGSFFENIDIETSLESYLESSESRFTAEFLAPGAKLENNPDKSQIEDMIRIYASQSYEAVEDSGTTFYSDKIWKDSRIEPLGGTEVGIEQVRHITQDVLSACFEKTELIKGNNYSGVLATK